MTSDDTDLVILLLRLYACRQDVDPELRAAALRGAERLAATAKEE